MACDFESSTKCGYLLKLPNERYTWTWHAGGTATSGTGPNADHTLGTPQGHYVFMESSSPMAPNNTAHLISPQYTPQNSGSQICLTFYYQMFGQNVGALNLYQTNGGTSPAGQPVWSRNFNQGQPWHQGQATLNPSGAYRVRNWVLHERFIKCLIDQICVKHIVFLLLGTVHKNFGGSSALLLAMHKGDISSAHLLE